MKVAAGRSLFSFCRLLILTIGTSGDQLVLLLFESGFHCNIYYSLFKFVQLLVARGKFDYFQEKQLRHSNTTKTTYVVEDNSVSGTAVVSADIPTVSSGTAEVVKTVDGGREVTGCEFRAVNLEAVHTNDEFAEDNAPGAVTPVEQDSVSERLKNAFVAIRLVRLLSLFWYHTLNIPS